MEDYRPQSNCVYTPPVCGDGIPGTGEECDNGNLTGCENCTIVAGYTCSTVNGSSVCTTICGDGILLSG